MDEVGCDLVETTAHAGARPSHAQWQGKVFSKSGTHPKYPPLTEGTGYGTGAGLGGWNCRHSMYPFFDGASEPTHTREELAEYNNPKYEYNGKKLTEYEAVSEQRKIERNIRRWKREYLAMDAAGLDTTEAAEKAKSWKERLKDFHRQTGLKGRYSRHAGKNTARAPRLMSGQSDSKPLSPTPKFVEKVDATDTELIKSKIKEFEDSVVGEPIEHAYVILANGKSYRFAGDAGGVDPSALGESLKGAIVSHNHPAKETPFSFSEDDFAFFQKYGLLELNGIDEKYHYTLKRDLPAAIHPELENLTLGDINEEIYCHYLTYNRAKEANVYYERAARPD